MGRVIFNTVLKGAPRTKKNHGSVISRWSSKKGKNVSIHVPSEAHQAWYNLVLPYANVARSRAGNVCPIGQQVNCRALIYREAETGDAVGYYQAIADLLQAAAIVRNDKLIVAWDGTRLLKDRENPRIEIHLELFDGGMVQTTLLQEAMA